MDDPAASESIRVAAVQAALYLDLDATVDKVVALISEAARSGAKLVGFPESFIPGFPLWVFKSGPLGPGSQLFHRLYKNAINVDSDHVAVIGEAARIAGIYVSASRSVTVGRFIFRNCGLIRRAVSSESIAN